MDNMYTFAKFLIFLGLASQQSGNPVDKPQFMKPAPMPDYRASESYAIYTQLLNSGPIEWRNAPRKQWLIEDTTNALSLDTPCQPEPKGLPFAMNPHTAVKAPAERQMEWAEVLADYDQHCHDVIKLDSRLFKTELPVHLLNEEERNTYSKDPRHTPPALADGAGLHRFTEVFFNANHTLALVEQGMYCGGLCGNWSWVVLERKEGQWKILPWVHTFMVS